MFPPILWDGTWEIHGIHGKIDHQWINGHFRYRFIGYIWDIWENYYINGGVIISMAMQQEPIDWRYRFHICLAYFLGLNFREDPHKIWPNIWYVYVPPFLDPGIPIEWRYNGNWDMALGIREMSGNGV
jgi:hypothetical protein